MDFRILGPLEVSEGGEPLALGGPRQRALLALLLLRANETVSRDWLIDELWESSPPRSGATALHNQVARLRRTLGPERLLTRDEGYALRVKPGELDLHRFRELIADAGDRPERLREALALWRGAALSGVAVGPFAQVEAARLEELRLEVLEDLIDAELELGRNAELVPELTALVASHPLSERLRGQLILALYRSGRQAEALDVYRETRRLLDEELGLEPSPALRELERAILRHDPALAPARRSAPPADAPSRRRHAYLAAAAVALVAAGSSSAWLLVRDTTGDPIATPTTGAVSTSTAEETPIAAPLPAPAPKPTRSAKQSAKPRQKQKAATPTKTNARRIAAKPAVVTATTAPPEPRPATTAPKPEPKPKARPKPKPERFTISDDFSGAAMDPLVWYPIGKEHGAAFTHRDGRLEITVLPEAQPDPQWNTVGGHYGTHCRFTGEFDATVDFELLEWPSKSGVYAGLHAFFADAFVGRQSSVQWGDHYGSWVVPAAGGPPLPDTEGKLRMKRVDGVITTYFWHEGRWRAIVSGTSRGAAVLGLQAQANGDEFSRHEVRVAFDNFSVTATEADCPPFADPRP